MRPNTITVSSLLLILSSIACGDPVPNADVPPPDAPPPEPLDGDPAAPASDPSPNVESEAAIPVDEDPTSPDMWTVAPGEGVELSGTVSYGGTTTGGVFLDVLDASGADLEDSKKMLHSAKLNGMGAWSLHAPAGTGAVHLCAFVDADDNGPTPADPKAITLEPVVIRNAAVQGIELVLLDDWDIQHPETLTVYQSAAAADAGGAAPPLPEGAPTVPADGEPNVPADPNADPTPPDGGDDGAPPGAETIDPGAGGLGLLDPARSQHDMSCPFHGLGLAYLTETTE